MDRSQELTLKKRSRNCMCGNPFSGLWSTQLEVWIFQRLVTSTFHREFASDTPRNAVMSLRSSRCHASGRSTQQSGERLTYWHTAQCLKIRASPLSHSYLHDLRLCKLWGTDLDTADTLDMRTRHQVSVQILESKQSWAIISYENSPRPPTRLVFLL